MKNVLLNRTTLLVVLTASAWAGCYYDNEETLYPSTINCSSTSYSYASGVSTIISTYCATAGCHNNANAGGVTLLTYSQAKENASRINQRVVVDKTMPPGGGLTAAQLASIKCWIANGTPQ
jgi:uncharacterized membrane protein